jgi:hypothetical protein
VHAEHRRPLTDIAASLTPRARLFMSCSSKRVFPTPKDIVPIPSASPRISRSGRADWRPRETPGRRGKRSHGLWFRFAAISGCGHPPRERMTFPGMRPAESGGMIGDCLGL